MTKIKYTGWSFLLLLCVAVPAFSQEVVAPLRYNPRLDGIDTTTPHPARKTTALGLPFFEDFTDYTLYPNSARWTDSLVYINNTMGKGVISRGVATFDALNKRGRPYDTINHFNLLFADSLTSQPFDLSAYAPGDSIYLSFFYQPQGMGFSPEAQDSLMLLFRPGNGGWRTMWSVPGEDLQPFRQVMVRIADTSFLYNGFQFRFVNKASINTNDDIWNVDYIRIAESRNINDTAVRDLAFADNPTFLLNDYTSMPYRQYLANAAGERAASQIDTIANHYGTNSTVGYAYQAIETTTGTPLSNANGSANIPAYSRTGVSFPTYSATVTPPSSTARIVYQSTWSLQSGSPTEPKDNDTIVHEQVFDNYLAYDDGTAEKSYFLNLAQALPGKTAIEFRLNAPDTLRGVAIYFGQQVPTATNKSFSVVAYSELAGIAGALTDKKLFEQSDLLPLFQDVVNHFTVYKFDSPIELPAGVFYLGTTQPASSGSDSLYIGLDANRVGSNHLYVNLYNAAWQSSGVSGALMIRPLLGRPVTGTAVQDARIWSPAWSLYPNPVAGTLHIASGPDAAGYSISDMQGRIVQEGPCTHNSVAINSLAPGMYLLRIRQRDTWSLPQKFIKQ
jgi:hypothetical protein